METILAWHFLKGDSRTGYGNLLAVAGETMTVTGPVRLCHNGFHFSIRAIDALINAPSAKELIIQRVQCAGEIIMADDKGVCSERTCLWLANATRVLHDFACRVAEDALSLIPNPDPRSIAAIAAKRKWIRGEISDTELNAAYAAAYAADFAAYAAAYAVAKEKYNGWLEEMLLALEPKSE